MTLRHTCLQVMEAGYQQELLRADRLEERNKGLLWLAVLTLAVLWVAGDAAFFDADSRTQFSLQIDALQID